MISRTTTNYAEKRDLDITTYQEGKYDFIWIWEADEEMEALVMYYANEDGSFTYFKNVTLALNIKAELPAHIRDEKHLREVLDFISKELAK